jgi:hypothetical protein
VCVCLVRFLVKVTGEAGWNAAFPFLRKTIQVPSAPLLFRHLSVPVDHHKVSVQCFLPHKTLKVTTLIMQLATYFCGFNRRRVTSGHMFQDWNACHEAVNIYVQVVLKLMKLAVVIKHWYSFFFCPSVYPFVRPSVRLSVRMQELDSQ